MGLSRPQYQNVTSGHIWPINVVEWEDFNETIRDVSAGEHILEAVTARALLDLAFQDASAFTLTRYG